MNENGTKRREWVKNAAIIFLSIMLILTFFSNTIMNYSLPEVATQYVQSGTITAKIRGTGTIESGDPYNIQIKETRTVESVNVRVGDAVQKGDVLFVLADKESDELKAAEEALKAAQLNFELQILNGSISNSAVSNVQSGNISSVSGYQNKILAAEAEIEKWEKEVADIELKISQLNALKGQLDVSTPDTSAEERKVAEAQAALNADPVKIAKDKIADWTAKKAEYEKIIYEREVEKIVVDWKPVSGGDAEPVYSVSDEDYASAKANKATYEALIAAEEPITKDATAVAAYDKRQEELNKANTELNNKKNSVSDSSTSVSVQLTNWNLELTDKNKKLADAQAAKTQLLADIAAELNLDSQKDKIAEQREEVERLRAEATGAVIEAPISGTISSISVTAGQDTAPGTPIATMQPEGKGYTMSFSVTTAQAQKLSVGVQADLVNAWRYDDVTVTLSKIKPDPSDPSQKKLLTFDVTGDVTAGQSLSVSVGDRSATYDMIVPNSAIREDNNGKFVLIIQTQSSPLGNRYRATRVDVEVLASDDTQSAINGALESYSYVITTSTKPVEAGQLVRLPD